MASNESRNKGFTAGANRWKGMPEKGSPNVRRPSVPNRHKENPYIGNPIYEKWLLQEREFHRTHPRHAPYRITGKFSQQAVDFIYAPKLPTRRGHPYRNYQTINMVKYLWMLASGMAEAAIIALLSDTPPPPDDRADIAIATFGDDPRFNFGVVPSETIKGYRTWDILETDYYLWKDGDHYVISSYPGDYVPDYTWILYDTVIEGTYNCYGGFGYINLKTIPGLP